MLFPRLDVVVRPNHISVRSLDSGQVASAEGPFSCDHLLVDDVDILEHVIRRALHQFAGRFWSFPRVVASTDGQPIHRIEQKVIRDALLNAGASRVVLNQSIHVIDEQTAARAAYIEQAKRKR